MSTKFSWAIRPTDGDVAPNDELRDSLPLLVRRLLTQRGISDPDAIEKYLRPKLANLSDPFELKEMDAAVARIFQAIDKDEQICIYGDYDVDGVSSVTILYRILQAYNASTNYFIPVRTIEGYGLSEVGISHATEQCSRPPQLFICVDCGTSSVDEVNLLNQRGVDVIILDHHEAGTRGRPAAVAVVNAKLEDNSPYTYLCSAGVVFKLAHALMKLRRLPQVDLRQFLDLVAIATVADIVPLVEENRLMTRHGLRVMEQSQHLGLVALNRMVKTRLPLTSSQISFRLGPRLNAAGRMDSPLDALQLLLAEDWKDAVRLARRLDSLNQLRQQEEEKIRDEAIAMLQHHYHPESDEVIVLGSRSWHPGVVGIVASLLMRRYHKPCFIISFDKDGLGKGSGRSVPGISLVQAIHACSDTLISGGGHEMAAGIVMQESQLEGFREAFNNFVKKELGNDKKQPQLLIDAEVDFSELNLELLDSYELLEPFGNANPQPIFLSRNVMLSQAPRRLAGGHMRLVLRQKEVECEVMFFNGSQTQLPDPPWDIAFTIDRNVWKGRVSVNLVLQDIRPAE